MEKDEKNGSAAHINVKPDGEFEVEIKHETPEKKPMCNSEYHLYECSFPIPSD